MTFKERLLLSSALRLRTRTKKAKLIADGWHDRLFARGIANPGLAAFTGGSLLFLVAAWLPDSSRILALGRLKALKRRR